MLFNSQACLPLEDRGPRGRCCLLVAEWGNKAEWSLTSVVGYYEPKLVPAAQVNHRWSSPNIRLKFIISTIHVCKAKVFENMSAEFAWGVLICHQLGNGFLEENKVFSFLTISVGELQNNRY